VYNAVGTLNGNTLQGFTDVRSDLGTIIQLLQGTLCFTGNVTVGGGSGITGYVDTDIGSDYRADGHLRVLGAVTIAPTNVSDVTVTQQVVETFGLPRPEWATTNGVEEPAVSNLWAGTAGSTQLVSDIVAGQSVGDTVSLRDAAGAGQMLARSGLGLGGGVSNALVGASSSTNQGWSSLVVSEGMPIGGSLLTNRLYALVWSWWGPSWIGSGTKFYLMPNRGDWWSVLESYGHWQDGTDFNPNGRPPMPGWSAVNSLLAGAGDVAFDLGTIPYVGLVRAVLLWLMTFRVTVLLCTMVVRANPETYKP
jgi:hypothetical protein